MRERDQKIQDMKEKMNRVEDDIFADFCQQVGIANIRQYEERELRSQQERAKKRLEFENHISRIKNQLDFENTKDLKSKFFAVIFALSLLTYPIVFMETPPSNKPFFFLLRKTMTTLHL